jgi:hypothetical protein
LEDLTTWTTGLKISLVVNKDFLACVSNTKELPHVSDLPKYGHRHYTCWFSCPCKVYIAHCTRCFSLKSRPSLPHIVVFVHLSEEKKEDVSVREHFYIPKEAMVTLTTSASDTRKRAFIETFYDTADLLKNNLYLLHQRFNPWTVGSQRTGTKVLPLA